MMNNTIDIISRIGTPFIIGIVSVFISYLIWKLLDVISVRTTKFSDLSIEFDKKLESIRTESETTKLTKVIENKKVKLLNLPTVSFHFADKERIRDFYNDYFREPTVESMVKELVSEVSGNIKGSLPKILEAKVGGKDLTKWISTSKLPKISLSGMFLRYQRETIKNQQVALDIELVDVELNQLEKFQEHIIQLRDEYEFELPKDKIEKHSMILKEKAAEKTLIKLEKTSGWVIVEGSFTILEESTGFYKCILRHPVSSYISGHDKTVSISFMIQKSNLESSVSGNYKQSIGRNIPLKVYGEVWQPINREQDVWDLQLTPLAVY